MERVRRAQDTPGKVSTPTKRAEAGRQVRPPKMKRRMRREAEEAEETEKSGD